MIRRGSDFTSWNRKKPASIGHRERGSWITRRIATGSGTSSSRNRAFSESRSMHFGQKQSCEALRENILSVLPVSEDLHACVLNIGPLEVVSPVDTS